MLIPKIIITFITLIFTILCFSVIYFVFYNYLPKLDIFISYIIDIQNPFSTHLCQNFLLSEDFNFVINRILIEKIKKEEEVNKIRDAISRLIGNRDFEISIENFNIRKGKAVLEEIYICYVLKNNTKYEVRIKL